MAPEYTNEFAKLALHGFRSPRLKIESAPRLKWRRAPRAVAAYSKAQSPAHHECMPRQCNFAQEYNS